MWLITVPLGAGHWERARPVGQSETGESSGSLRRLPERRADREGEREGRHRAFPAYPLSSRLARLASPSREE